MGSLAMNMQRNRYMPVIYLVYLVYLLSHTSPEGRWDRNEFYLSSGNRILLILWKQTGGKACVPPFTEFESGALWQIPSQVNILYCDLGVGRLILLHTNTHDLITRTSQMCEHTLSFNLHKNKATTEAADGAQIYCSLKYKSNS